MTRQAPGQKNRYIVFACSFAQGRGASELRSRGDICHRVNCGGRD